MTALPLDLYDAAIASHSGPDGCRCDEWHVRYADGRAIPLAVARWVDPPDAADLELLSRCDDPTLDIGCGPGRLVAALTLDGREALGVDIAPGAVRLARTAGARVIRRSVFDPLPGEGTWRSLLLADGNIGIGGDPVGLLRRCAELMSDDGQVLVELDRPGSRSVSSRVRLEVADERSEWFPWAHLAVDAIDAPARAAGLAVVDSWSMNDRWFACLAR